MKRGFLTAIAVLSSAVALFGESDVSVVPHERSDVFNVVLGANDGTTIEAQITRTQSVEQIPFMVEYRLDDPHGLQCQWTCIETGDEISGNSAGFVLRSNANAYTFSLSASAGGGKMYSWQDRDVDFPLHSQTEILLDATAFGNGDESASIAWTVENGDPADAITFPISNSASSEATLVSDWPNVLTISCSISKGDASAIAETINALVYFRDGTPFEIRGVAAAIGDPHPLEDWRISMTGLFKTVHELGYNTITTHVSWYFGEPDIDGIFTLHPLYAAGEAELDPRGGYTASIEQLAEYAVWALKENVDVAIQIHPKPYWHGSFDPEAHTGYMATDGFLYGEGQGLKAFFESFVPLLASHPAIQTVFLGAEHDYFISGGGEKTRSFYRELLQVFRTGGFDRNLSYASSAFLWDEVELLNALLTPSVCGIPFGDMDYTGLTFYVPLADRDGYSTQEMLERARRYVERYLSPLAGTYGNPLYIVDFYGNSHDGCSINPVAVPPVGAELDFEESRRWHTAWLRAFAEMNSGKGPNLLARLTVGNYWLIPSRFAQTRPLPYDALHGPNVNEDYDREWYRNLIKVYLSDEPLRMLGS